MGTDDGTLDTAAAVAANLAAIRRRRGLTVRQLSQRLSELGAPILPSGITKIEQGQRRVDVNDLMALAVALNVSPARLLLPDVGQDDVVAVAPNVQRPLWSVWQWAEGQFPLPKEDLDLDVDAAVAFRDLRPAWMRARDEHPLVIAVELLRHRVLRILYGQMAPEQRRRRLPKLSLTVNAARRALRGVADALDQIEEDEDDRGKR